MKNKMALIVFSNEIDKLISTFNLALGGASMEMDVTLFFTFWGLELL
jgi:peroxiredoxin family protein